MKHGLCYEIFDLKAALSKEYVIYLLKMDSYFPSDRITWPAEDLFIVI